MSSEQDETSTEGSTDRLARAARGEEIHNELMPTPDLRVMLPMRDGIRLDTLVWLPAAVRAGAQAPAILSRTPYRQEVLGWARLGQMRYVDEGYVLIYQLIRGTGDSEGTFSFSAPHERHDGYDTVEWIASQPWCDGNVGMDGGSYVGMTQLAAAAARPPHLKCIIPHVPSADFFREIPYFGGGFSRQHTLNWTNLISVNALAELTGGFVEVMPILAKPEWLSRVTSRPVSSAGDDLLKGDKLAHFRDVLAHPTFDSWWQERTLQPDDYAAMDLPALLVSGVFDMSIGAMTVWKGWSDNAPPRDDRQLLIGPWDHGQSYVGTGNHYGPFDLGDAAPGDPYPVRLAFFNHHLKGEGPGPDLGGRARIFFTGAKRYRSFSAYPPSEGVPRTFFLKSGGRANTLRGDGRLCDTPPVQSSSSPDTMRSDPTLPFVPAMTSALGLQRDLREVAGQSETLVYVTEAFDAPFTVIGEPEVILHVAANVPDADIGVYVAEVRPDGMIAQLSHHFLRLRYRQGFDREVALTPLEVVEAKIKLTFLAHEFAPGTKLAVLLRPDMFPWVDPNPHTGEAIADAVEMRPAEISVMHTFVHQSRLVLTIL